MIRRLTLDYTCDLISRNEIKKSLASRDENLDTEEKFEKFEELVEDDCFYWGDIAKESFNFDFERETEAVIAPIGNLRKIYRLATQYRANVLDRDSDHDLYDALALAYGMYAKEQGEGCDMLEDDFEEAISNTKFGCENGWHEVLENLNCPLAKSSYSLFMKYERDDHNYNWTLCDNTMRDEDMLFFVRDEDYDTLQAEVAALMLAAMHDVKQS